MEHIAVLDVFVETFSASIPTWCNLGRQGIE
jgi:hypothetical protein